MRETMARLRERTREILEAGEARRAIAWRAGRFFWQSPPSMASSPGEVEGLTFTPTSAPGPIKYVMDLVREAENPHIRTIDEEELGRTAVWARGCDSRAINRLIQDGVFERDRVLILGISCPGVADPERIREAAGDGERIESVEWADGEETAQAEGAADPGGDGSPGSDTTGGPAGDPDANGSDRVSLGSPALLVKTASGTTTRLKLADVLQDKCRICTHPTPVACDELFGVPTEPIVDPADRFAAVRELEGLGSDERYAFWSRHFDRCIRCYACRNACPACSCRECVFDSALPDRPDWLSKASTLAEKHFFQLTRLAHVASRCIECGECERVCPMGIPVTALMQKAAADIDELFGPYEAGLDPEGVPPLQTYSQDDPEFEEGGSQ